MATGFALAGIIRPVLPRGGAGHRGCHRPLLQRAHLARYQGADGAAPARYFKEGRPTEGAAIVPGRGYAR